MHIRRTVWTGSKLIALFAGAVPEPLVKALVGKRLQLSPELAKNFNEHGRTSHEVFGDSANEVFMAWNYANKRRQLLLDPHRQHIYRLRLYSIPPSAAR